MYLPISTTTNARQRDTRKRNSLVLKLCQLHTQPIEQYQMHACAVQEIDIKSLNVDVQESSDRSSSLKIATSSSDIPAHGQKGVCLGTQR